MNTKRYMVHITNLRPCTIHPFEEQEKTGKRGLQSVYKNMLRKNANLSPKKSMFMLFYSFLVCFVNRSPLNIKHLEKKTTWTKL